MHPISILDLPPVSRHAELPLTPAPHKNDPVLLEEIKNDPTKCLTIDVIARNIHYYGELATKIYDLSFQPDTKDRGVIVYYSILLFTRVNQTAHRTFTLNE